ncbi:uncharacterized protein HGUI_01401 [Hanseniaspora guilliermondii]|uniref:C2H2-type domain-containing protein n=1 Tax=Hanseniaspora guilliermondii TaxID=56406 RepID=A0A1L0CLD5_9ASCO|nr:uncharacterized protein HGUI_01401 [Hanseniaspora guilliermondii]
MNQTNHEQAYPESFSSLYSSYDQQLEQYISRSNSNINNIQKDTSNKQISQSNLNNENLSYHLYDDYDFNYYLDDGQRLDKSNSLRQDINQNDLTPTNSSNINNFNQITNHQEVASSGNNFSKVNNTPGLINDYKNMFYNDTESSSQQDQLAIAQQYYLLQLKQKQEEYDHLKRINNVNPANQMAFEGMKHGADLVFQQGTGDDKGHILVSAAPEHSQNNNSSPYMSNSNEQTSDSSSGIGVYLSEIDGEFFLVDAFGNPLANEFSDKIDECKETEAYGEKYIEDERELRQLLMSLLETNAEKEKMQQYIEGSDFNTYNGFNLKSINDESDEYSNFDKLNLNQQHTTKVRTEQINQQQERATERIKEILRANPALQINPKTIIELESLPEHLKEQILKNKKSREVEAKYIELSEKHNFNPVQLRILQNHLSSYNASTINRNAASVVNQYNHAASNKFPAQRKKHGLDGSSRKSKYKSLLKKFQINSSSDHVSLEDEAAKIQDNIIQLNNMIMSSQTTAMEQLRFYEEILNANCTLTQLKQLYIQSQGQQQVLIKDFIQIMEVQQQQNPYLITSNRVNIDNLHSKVQNELIEQQQKQQEMIKEQQENLINLQKLYESGQRFVPKKDQINNIMDILASQQRSKNITLDKDAPASFHVYKSYKSKKPSSTGKKTDKTLQNKNSRRTSSNDNSTIGSTFYNSNQSSYPNTFLEHNTNDDHLSIGNSRPQMSILSPQGSTQTSRSNNSPMMLERSTTPLSMRPGSSHATSNTSLTNSPSLVGSLSSKTRGRKATKKTDSYYTCPYCFSPDEDLSNFDYKSIKSNNLLNVPMPLGGKNTSFSRKDHLVRHINSVHKKIKPHMCVKCGKRFARTDNLKHHVATCKQ